MKNIQYELTCPHCGQKYIYDMRAGDPAMNDLPKCCDRCGLSEPIKNYFRMNCIPNEQEGKHTVLDYLNTGKEQNSINKHIIQQKGDNGCNTVVMEKTVMTLVNKAHDPHLFCNPATLINQSTGESLTMSVGEQTVGRMAPVDGPDKGFHDVPRTVSRRHVCITTVETGDGHYVNLIMNSKNTNQTLLNGKELPTGAVWKLAKGMTLTMGELTVIVEDI